MRRRGSRAAAVSELVALEAHGDGTDDGDACEEGEELHLELKPTVPLARQCCRTAKSQSAQMAKIGYVLVSKPCRQPTETLTLMVARPSPERCANWEQAK